MVWVSGVLFLTWGEGAQMSLGFVREVEFCGGSVAIGV